MAAEDIGADYADVTVDEVAAAAVAAATAQAPTVAEPEAPRTYGRRASRRTSKRRSHEELAARAIAEDAWVRADLRRIAVVSAVLLAVLAVAWVLFSMLDVLGLY